ncbi:uncharacterized protein LOC100374836 [Saccoglossus kowalevskii]|uniref:Probable galacturonosyltransferase-like 10-like n=1 Tax=Saccoglossus kowalevskii TaxID=10224 RepID=A0ABM0GT82_SACKO|nr:PREDICTED: probable galacturonosyltransferase-like 10-like [Saccoglossus kowalevskii]
MRRKLLVTTCIYMSTFAVMMYVGVYNHLQTTMDLKNSSSEQNDSPDSATLYQTHQHRVPDNNIHIIMATDLKNFAGAPVVINSLLRNTGVPEKIRIHFVVCGESIESMKQYLQCHDLDIPPDMIEMVTFDSSILDPDIVKLWEHSYYIPRLKSSCNYARAYFYRLFPEVSKAIYLDMDLVVDAPIEDLWSEASSLTAPFLAVKNNHGFEQEGFRVDVVSKLYQKRYHRTFNKTATIFNCGVFVIDLDYYRSHRIVSEVEFWLKMNARFPENGKLWMWDAQAIIQLLFHKNWQPIDRKWNIEYLGAPGVLMTEGRRRRLGNGGILHWTGDFKPFLPNGLNKEFWEVHQPGQCSGHGECSRNEDSEVAEYWICKCQRRYTGRFCEDDK